jgi:hypothetical protein
MIKLRQEKMGVGVDEHDAKLKQQGEQVQAFLFPHLC